MQQTQTYPQQSLEALFKIAAYLGSPESFETNVFRSLEVIAEALSADRISLRLVDPVSGSLHTVCRAGRLAFATESLDVTDSGQGFSGKAFELDDIVVVDDYEESTFSQPALTTVGICSAVGVPIRLEDSCVGVLTLYSVKRAHFDANRVKLLEGIQASIGALIIQARLREDIEREHEINERHEAFMAVATHELRTPLTTIRGYSEPLIAQEALEGDQERWLEAINASAREVAAIVDGIATAWALQGDTAKDESLFDACEVATNVVEMLDASVPTHTIQIAVAAGPSRVVGDPDRLRQVLEALIENAMKYSPADTAVSLTVEPDEAHGRVMLAVSDAGPGIAPPLRPHVFAPFYRIDGQISPVRGAGLGLHIARVNVESMGGTIWIDDSVSVGTTVRFFIPGLKSQPRRISALPGARISRSFGLSLSKISVRGSADVHLDRDDAA